ncbi:MAG: deoxyribose-phosphate aldolase, partial [Treponema sp.]|nr:deoxyribose-phosphate aldolase [Treponema sp.]
MNVDEIMKETNRALDALIGPAFDNAGFGAGIVPRGGAPAGHTAAGSAPAYVAPGTVRGQGVNASVPGKLEHSLLDPSITREKIIAECGLAGKYGLASVVVSPYYVECASDILSRTGVAVCSVAGFPHGAASAAAKSAELRECIRRGAVEMDVAVNILAIKSGETDAARRELQELLQIARGKCLIKAIYEQSLYSDEEKKTVLSLIRECGCDFVKISNALTGKKAEEADVRFVRGIVGNKVGVKIDGGVKTLERTLEILGAGADRIGMSATIAVAKECLG